MTTYKNDAQYVYTTIQDIQRNYTISVLRVPEKAGPDE